VNLPFYPRNKNTTVQPVQAKLYSHIEQLLIFFERKLQAERTNTSRILEEPG
jgi:hypothetical protein